MKIKSREVLITKVEAKKTKDGADYISISFLDMLSGDTFTVISKNLEHMKLRPMTKYNTTLNLTSSKYGLKLELDTVEKELGGI